MALRLARLFANDAAFWLILQRAADVYDARVAITADLTQIKPLCVP
jgi:plasmid maintenance system antidote protein VapI